MPERKMGMGSALVAVPGTAYLRFDSFSPRNQGMMLFAFY